MLLGKTLPDPLRSCLRVAVGRHSCPRIREMHSAARGGKLPTLPGDAGTAREKDCRCGAACTTAFRIRGKARSYLPQRCSFLRMNSSAKSAVPSIPSTDESMQRW